MRRSFWSNTGRTGIRKSQCEWNRTYGPRQGTRVVCAVLPKGGKFRIDYYMDYGLPVDHQKSHRSSAAQFALRWYYAHYHYEWDICASSSATKTPVTLIKPRKWIRTFVVGEGGRESLWDDGSSLVIFIHAIARKQIFLFLIFHIDLKGECPIPEQSFSDGPQTCRDRPGWMFLTLIFYILYIFNGTP